MWAHRLLVATVLWMTWFPVETVPGSGVILSLVILLLVPWAWGKTDVDASKRWTLSLSAAGGLLVLSAASGWDRAQAVGELGLLAAVLSIIFLASRETPQPVLPKVLALGLAALTLVALWQVMVGFDRILTVVPEFSEAAQQYALSRINSGRAFASLLLPGHLAVLLATALVMLVPGLAWRRSAAPAWIGAVLCVGGLYLTYSPLGIALAAAGCLVLSLRQRHWMLLVLVGILAVGIATAFAMRPDLADSEPIRLRLDNWKTAVWLWSTAPVTGVGFASYGLASQAVPFKVGNLPAHAHCLPLEVTAELGLTGIALLALAAAALAGLAGSLWRKHPGLAVAVLLVPLHNLADFSLYTSGVALPWALLTGWAVSLARSSPAVEVRATNGRVWVVTAAAVAFVLVTLNSTSVIVERAYIDDDNPCEASNGLLRSHHIAPWRASPIAQLPGAALACGEKQGIEDAEDVLRTGLWLRPDSAAFASGGSLLALARSEAPTALARAFAAHESQPRNEGHEHAFQRLIDRLEDDIDAPAP